MVVLVALYLKTGLLASAKGAHQHPIPLTPLRILGTLRQAVCMDGYRALPLDGGERRGSSSTCILPRQGRMNEAQSGGYI
jgi:hypothetical protein